MNTFKTAANKAAFEAGKAFSYTISQGISARQIKAIMKATGGSKHAVLKGFFAGVGELVVKDGYEEKVVNA